MSGIMWARFININNLPVGSRCFSNIKDMNWRHPNDWSDAKDFRLVAKEIQNLVVGPSGELEDLESVGVKDQSELPLRSPRDSFAKAVLPLKTDKTLRTQSINTFGSVRVGRILEALDAMAAFSAFKYCLNPARIVPSPYLLVTALVDKIVPRLGEVTPGSPQPNRIDPYDNVYFSGFVSWVGKSSMEVMVNMWQKHQLVIEAACVFVARDSTTLEATPVNPIKLEDQLDKDFFQRGAKNHELRKQYEKESLFKQPPDSEESEILHQHFLDAVEKRIYQGIEMADVDKGEGCVFMEETKLSNTVNCHPENRNTHNKIFGGMLMRLASEIAWGTAVMHCKTNPVLLCVDDIWFRLPVDIGSLIQFDSVICYTEDCHMVMRVDARVLDPMTGNKEMTNTFFIMYRTPTNEPVLQVKPRTYADCILYLEGRRHFGRMMKFLATTGPGSNSVQPRRAATYSDRFSN